MPTPTPEKPLTTEERVAAIQEILEQMNHRDKLRTWGAFFRGLLSLIPLALVLLSTWYIYKNADFLLEKAAQEAAKQAAIYTQSQSQGLLDRMQKFLPGTTTTTTTVK